MDSFQQISRLRRLTHTLLKWEIVALQAMVTLPMAGGPPKNILFNHIATRVLLQFISEPLA